MLNADQKKAVQNISGPLLIIAGAGTGKTTTIIEKIAFLIEKKKVKPENILGLTFTEKASNEMEERIDQRLPFGYFQLNISTFHAFCDQILRSESSHIGVSPLYRLLSEAETVMFLREHLFLFNLKYFRPLGNPNKFLDALLQHFSRLRDEDISPAEYMDWAKKMNKKRSLPKEEREKNLELATAFETFQTVKQRESVFDYADLIYYTLELFRKRPHILKRFQKQYKHVLVDEFQDTNIAQYSLIKLLAPPKGNLPAKALAKAGPNLTVVGDDSQAIYKFRGASVSNILAFMKDYKSARQITLKNNYRSTQIILDRAYKLIKHNDPDTLEAKLGISKELVATRKMPRDTRYAIHDIRTLVSDRGEDEADQIAKEIKSLNKKYKYSDVAILVRANNHADAVTRALSQRGVPYQFLGPGALFKQPEVKDLIAYLNVLANLDDSVSLYRVLEMELFDISSKDISLLLTFARRASLTLFEAVEMITVPDNPEQNNYKSHVPKVSIHTKKTLAIIYTLIQKHLNRVKRDTAGQILYYFLEDSGYLQKIAKYKTEKDERIALNISKFFDKLKSYEITHEDANIYAAVDFIKMSMELGESPNAVDLDKELYDAVKILTIHSAKGLEFPVVFLINLTQDRFPTRERKETIPIPKELIKETLPSGDFHLQEERRLFYVGMTRAMELLYFTASRYYGEGKRLRKFSPFIYESLAEQQLMQIFSAQKEEKNQLSIFEVQKESASWRREKLPLKKLDQPTILSFTQIDTYQLCPLKYKYQYVLKIPTVPGGQASLGTTVHNTLEQFYIEFMNNKNIKKERLLDLFEESWIPVGYTSKNDEQNSKKEGKKMLLNYFKTFHSKTLMILDLEKSFKIKIGTGDDVFINGKIDRLDGTSQNGIEIIDYKTGNLQEEKKLKNSLQLSIYLLAATDKGLYNKRLSEVSLTFYYLQANKKITVDQTEDTLQKAKENILDAVENIKAEKFKPRVGPWCNFCQFKMVCEAWQ